MHKSESDSVPCQCKLILYIQSKMMATIRKGGLGVTLGISHDEGLETFATLLLQNILMALDNRRIYKLLNVLSWDCWGHNGWKQDCST